MTELHLAALESFHVGGERVAFRNSFGQPDEAIVGAMYVQRLCPAEINLSLPVVMVHGGCHTGVTWETTPDGREGWATLFARAGIDTYVVDQPWRGRSAFDVCDERPAKAGLSAVEMFGRGGARFPVAARHRYGAQLTPDFGIPGAIARGMPGLSDPRALAPFLALLDRIGPAVLITHSQGADLGWQAAIARPDKVAAILAIEPGVTSPGLDAPGFPAIPVCVMWGDNLPEDGLVLNHAALRSAREIAARDPLVCVDHLPHGGIFGNGHMLMMEDNNAELAERAVRWIERATGQTAASGA